MRPDLDRSGDATAITLKARALMPQAREVAAAIFPTYGPDAQDRVARTMASIVATPGWSSRILDRIIAGEGA